MTMTSLLFPNAPKAFPGYKVGVGLPEGHREERFRGCYKVHKERPVKHHLNTIDPSDGKQFEVQRAVDVTPEKGATASERMGETGRARGLHLGGAGICSKTCNLLLGFTWFLRPMLLPVAFTLEISGMGRMSMDHARESERERERESGCRPHSGCFVLHIWRAVLIREPQTHIYAPIDWCSF